MQRRRHTISLDLIGILCEGNPNVLAGKNGACKTESGPGAGTAL